MTDTIKFHRIATTIACVCCLLFTTHLSAQTSSGGQSTEGTDFWVTFLRADSHDSDDKPITLSVSISAREACSVTLSNPHSGYSETIQLAANELKEVELYDGTANVNKNPRNSDTKICYTYLPERRDSAAIHIQATANISLFASNYKSKSFDATNVLPTAALQDNYIIQTYPPSVHADTPQGSHFAIVATEDNTVVDYAPTVETEELRNFKNALNAWGEQVFENYPEYERFRNFDKDGTIATDTLQKGEVWYVWSGDVAGETADLSGTTVKARNGKKIAVFQGCPHTNIPDRIRDRDHIFSQAMPTSYWGNTFAITASMTRKRDIIRVLALNDGTEVRVNGQLLHTFDFSTNPKRTFEFEIGEQTVSCSDKNHKGNLPLAGRENIPVIIGTNCMVETSCPCAVHLFMCSNTYDSTPDGDPAMVWINPIEQVIDNITFATYMSTNTHYVNIVTTQDNVASMKLDGNDISADFSPVTSSNNAYWFARKNISHATHTLRGEKGFIAHVYGYGEKESYGYSAGGATKPLTQAITINGEIFTPESDNSLCGKDTIVFACQLNYEYQNITWCFGDGTPNVSGVDSIAHLYTKQGEYHAYVLIERLSTNLCEGQLAVDSIPIRVNIAHYTFDFNFRIDGVDVPCKMEDEPFEGKILYTNDSDVRLTELSQDECRLLFDSAAIAAGFDEKELLLTEDYIRISIPDGAKNSEPYGITINLNLHIKRECLDTTIIADTTIYFQLNYDSDILTQRFDYILGLRNDSTFEGDILSDFQWYRTTDSTAIANQQSAVLNLHDFEANANDSYYLCFILNKGTDKELSTCTCAKSFKKDSTTYNFADSITISTYTAPVGSRIYINAQGEASFSWYNTAGQLITSGTLPDKGGSVAIPAKQGLYILRVNTDSTERNFKFSVQ
ncbi:MAG: T9SS type A sorting domain-containing protein [Paludibacter sp.]|nr:T9SS type A sorting domain-containing protein [Bacteroidales bacterium]MCM1069997.1 T9SS type A sorting domain-containing protein [Prevotella sp.]MCM1354542.1 T9SS type A sorting domain-containing protein [Bacteroides sp.]MCM1443621.1 T9SS type A sorting domain-containing protein [Muribaculum sp.]MCM1482686.1 T9SS type A sorting domain-containing protein [Paludibacter sp.]